MIINLSKPGRLGNQLFLYAHLLAFSRQTNQTLINPAFQYSTLFQGTASKSLVHTQPSFKFFASLNSLISRLPHQSYFQSISLKSGEQFNLDSPSANKKLSPSKISFTQGWLFRGPKCLKKHSTYIRNFFQLTPNLNQKLGTLLPVQNSKQLIGIHARRGDYRNFQQGKYFYSWSAYQSIIYNLRKLFPRAQIVLVSDEPIPNQISNTKYIHTPKSSPVIDMYALAHCNYILGPPSTFSMWASFIGQKPLFMLETPKSPRSKKQFKVINS